MLRTIALGPEDSEKLGKHSRHLLTTHICIGDDILKKNSNCIIQYYFYNHLRNCYHSSLHLSDTEIDLKLNNTVVTTISPWHSSIWDRLLYVHIQSIFRICINDRRISFLKQNISLIVTLLLITYRIEILKLEPASASSGDSVIHRSLGLIPEFLTW